MAKPVLTTVVLAAITVFGYFGILDLVQKNGWAADLDELMGLPGAPMPDYLDVPGRRNITGFEGVDEAFRIIIRFFHPCTTGKHPALSLFSLLFTGQILPIHAIIVLEGLRKGNAWTVFWPAVLWTQLYQVVPLGVTIPIYAIIHIWRSPVSRLSPASGPSKKVEQLAMDPVKAAALPGALVMGCLVPTALMGLPSLFSFDAHQMVIALWQFFPLWVSLWLFDTVVFIAPFDIVPRSAQATPAAGVRYARHIYRAVLTLTAVVHLSALGLIFFPEQLTRWFPTLDTSTITPAAVLTPMSILEPRRISSFAEGTHTLLQYDLYSASAGIVVWALHQTYVSTDNDVTAVVTTAAKSAFRAILVGPGGAALWAVADRDARALREAEAQPSKKTQ